MKTLAKFAKGTTLSQVEPQIFVLKFKSNYDLCMTFLRYQEYYESPSPKFRGKPFTILDFMEWYSKKYSTRGIFFYTEDWYGFNLPGQIILDLKNKGIKDFNRYDEFMNDVYGICSKFGTPFYLIGVSGNGGAYEHEVAHGFYYTRPEYKRDMNKLVKALPADVRKKICDILRDTGYSSTVYKDEIQAYMSTGLSTTMKKKLKIERLRKPFIKLFNSYYKEQL